MNRLINKLDKRLAAKETQKELGFKRKERIAGPPSKSQVPIGAPEWAVSMCSTGKSNIVKYVIMNVKIYTKKLFSRRLPQSDIRAATVTT